MEDRFLVRYWVKDSKEYLNSNKLVYNDGTYTQVSTKQLPSGKYISYILYDWNTFEVIPEQCTGLKDKKGKLIYEGDIVKSRNPSKTVYKKFTVIYDTLKSAFIISDGSKLENYLGVFFDKDWCWDIEVVGNIHENANLLEQSDVAED